MRTDIMYQEKKNTSINGNTLFIQQINNFYNAIPELTASSEQTPVCDVHRVSCCSLQKAEYGKIGTDSDLSDRNHVR